MKRISIVTGASSGLGREYALQLSRTRSVDEIWILARRKDKLLDLSRELSLEHEGKNIHGIQKPLPRVVEIDLSGVKGVTLFKKLLQQEKDDNPEKDFIIDSLVNNAGFGTYGTVMETAMERQLEMIDVNVYSLTALCCLALPYMQSGSILINVASLAGYIPLGNFAVYGATKAYVLSFSTALAAEVADSGIFVATVCPGPVDTEFANVASRGARIQVVDGKNPAEVVAHSLRCIERGKRFALMAFKWKAKAFLSRFVPRYGWARHSYIHEKRPSK